MTETLPGGGPSPREHLVRCARDYEGIWRELDAARQERDPADPDWPEHVHIPLEVAGIALARWHAARGGPLPRSSDLIGPAFVLAGLHAWRATQGVYRFDPDLHAALRDTPVTGLIPGELLQRLPEWCVYLETPGHTAPLVDGGSTPLHGAWAWLDRVRGAGTDVLTLMLHVPLDGPPPVGHVPLVGSLADALAEVEHQWTDAAASGHARQGPASGYAKAACATFEPLISMLLYLCSDGAELGRPRPTRPVPKRTKHGLRIFPPVSLPSGTSARDWAPRCVTHCPPQPRIHRPPLVGTCGPARTSAARTGNTYLVGEGRQQRELRWIPPVAVNVEDLEGLPAAIRVVRQRSG